MGQFMEMLTGGTRLGSVPWIEHFLDRGPGGFPLPALPGAKESKTVKIRATVETMVIDGLGKSHKQYEVSNKVRKISENTRFKKPPLVFGGNHQYP